MRSFAPPALAGWMLELILPAASRREMVGDLTEEYAAQIESGHLWAASFWFWSQSIRSVSFEAWAILRNPSALNIGVAAIIYCLMAALKAGFWMVLSTLQTRPFAQIVVSPFVFLAITAVGGCLAARLGREATIFLSLMVSITVVVLVALQGCRTTVPWWYQFGFFVAGPINVLVAPAILWRPSVRSNSGHE
jgi:hypothetical protein